MKNKKYQRVLAVGMAVMLAGTVFTGCTKKDSSEESSTGENTQVEILELSASYSTADETESYDESTAVSISLNGSSASVNGKGAEVAEGTVTITKAGTYVVSGTLKDGQIKVDAADEDKVQIVLKNADITCTNSAGIYVVNADKVILTLAEGTTNTVTDGNTYVYADEENEEPNAAIFSKDDLTINGTGSLTVKGNFNNGIAGKDDVRILNSTITVEAANNGMKGKDSIGIKNAVISIVAGGDGIKSDNTEDAAKGYIDVNGAEITIQSSQDGIQAESNLLIKNTQLDITAGQGSSNTVQAGATESESMKGIKAGVYVQTEGSTITIDSTDDCIHSNYAVKIAGDTIHASSGDDGIHADSLLTIDGGNITVAKSYEGLEAMGIVIEDGTIHVTASDDGLNAGGGNDASSVNGRPGQNEFAADENCSITIHGGSISVDAGGDGIDSNGSVTMTGGEVMVNGPVNDGNGALDYNGTFSITGGILAAAGSSGMAQNVSESENQGAILVTFDSVQAAGTTVSLKSESGEELFTCTPTKKFACVVICTPKLQTEGTYSIYIGENQFTQFTLTDTVMNVTSQGASVSSGMQNGMRPGGNMPQNGGQRQGGQRTERSGNQMSQ